MQRKQIFWLMICCCLSWIPSQGQDYVTQVSSFSIEDGLSNRFVEYILKDSRGLMWMGTNNGLNLFDGQDFKVFFNEKNDYHFPVNGGVFEDVNGNIWSLFKSKISANNFSAHYLITDKLELVLIDEYYKDKIPFLASDIKDINQGANRVLYFFTNSGMVYKFDGNFRLIAKVPNPEILLQIFSISKTGAVYLLGLNKVIVIKEDGRSIKTIPVPPTLKTDIEYKRSVPIEIDGDLNWVPLDLDRKLLDQELVYHEDGSSRPMFKNPSAIKELYGQTESATFHLSKEYTTFFLKNNRLLLEFDLEGNFIRDYSSDIKSAKEDLYISTGFYKEDKRIWLANNEGFMIVDFNPNPFQQILTSTPPQSCRSIIPLSKDQLFFVTYGGAYEWNMTTDEINHFPTLGMKNYGAIKRKNGEIILGTHGFQLRILSSSKKGFRDIYQNIGEGDIRKTGFTTPFEDRNGTLWSNADKGLLYYDEALDSLISFKKMNGFEAFDNQFIKYFYEDDDGIWLATNDGLYLMDPEDGIVDFVKLTKGFNITHFYREGSIFWMATLDDGLIRWNQNSNSLDQFSIDNGFLDNRITAVYPDDNGFLWLPTYKGLIRFDKKNHTTFTFLESDGLSHEEFNQESHYQHTDGRLFFGGLNGINIFNPDSIKISDQKHAPLHLTGYYELESQSGILLDKTSELLKREKIEIAPSISSFRIHFALLNYDHSDKNRYAYRIKGFEEGWNFQKENYVRINSLPYGKYTLEIKAQDYTGRWSKYQLSIPVRIVTPYYAQSKWQLFGVGFLALLIFLGVKWRLRYLEKTKENLEQEVVQRTLLIDDQRRELENLNDTKDRLFAILAHDLKNPVIAFEDLAKSINYLLQSDEPERVVELGNFIEKEAAQLHHLLDNLLNWAMAQREELLITPTSLSLIETFENIAKTFEPLSERSGVSLESDLSEEIIVLADHRVLETVFRNLISNAFRYTNPGDWIKVTAEKNHENIQINISDNGLGMTKGEVSNLFQIKSKLDSKGDITTISLGLHLCRELMSLLNGKISAQSEKGKGTTLTLTLPIGI